MFSAYVSVNFIFTIYKKYDSVSFQRKKALKRHFGNLALRFLCKSCYSLDKRKTVSKINKVGMIDMFLGKKLEVKTKKEVKNRQVSPAWDKESSQGVLDNCFLFLRTFIED